MFDSRFDGINILCVWLSMKLSKLLLQKFWKFVDGTSSEDDAQASSSWSVFYDLVPLMQYGQ